MSGSSPRERRRVGFGRRERLERQRAARVLTGPSSTFAVPFPTVAMGTSGSPASRHPLRNTLAASGDVMHTQSQPAASASAAALALLERRRRFR